MTGSVSSKVLTNMTKLRQRNATANRDRKSARARALRLVPDTGDLEDFVHVVGASRGRSIRLMPFPLEPSSPTGLWIATEQADYVVYPEDASPAEKAAIICHELAHMLLHNEPVGGVDLLAEMAAMVAPRVDPAVARRFLARHGYLQDVEAEAETLATVLVTCLARRAERYAFSLDDVSDRLR